MLLDCLASAIISTSEFSACLILHNAFVLHMMVLPILISLLRLILDMSITAALKSSNAIVMLTLLNIQQSSFLFESILMARQRFSWSLNHRGETAPPLERRRSITDRHSNYVNESQAESSMRRVAKPRLVHTFSIESELYNYQISAYHVH